MKTLGIATLSNSRVSRAAEPWDEQVEQFGHRPRDETRAFMVVSADAPPRCRAGAESPGGRARDLAVVPLAIGVNGDGHREVLGMRVATSETGAAWNGFLTGRVARDLAGERLVISDAHAGGGHGDRRASARGGPAVKGMPHGVHDQPHARAVNAQL